MKALRDEILQMLANKPLSRVEVFQHSALAANGQQVAKALHELKSAGLIEQDTNNHYRLVAERGHTPPQPPPAEKPQKRVKPKPEAAEDRTKSKAADAPSWPRAGAKAAEDGAIHQLLASNAKAARTALEKYIHELDDPVLEHLLTSAGSAADALDTYREQFQ